MGAMCSCQVGGKITLPDDKEEYLGIFKRIAEAVVPRGEAAIKDDRWEAGGRTPANVCPQGP